MLTLGFVNCALPGRTGRWAIAIEGDTIVAVQPDGKLDVDVVYDLDGRLVSPSFVDAHTHLDKCFTSNRTRHAIGAELRTAIEFVREDKGRSFSVSDVRERAGRALKWSIRNGTGHIRSNVEVDRFVEFRALDGVRAALADCAGQIDGQVAAFAQEGWFDMPGTLEAGSGRYVADAVERGAEVIAGNVNAAFWPSRPEDQVDEIFELARRSGCDVDMHLDNWDGPESFTLPYVAEKTVEYGLEGRVTVAHVVSLGEVEEAAANAAIRQVVDAGISVAILPGRIRLAPARRLIEAGVNVCIGTDNLRDAFLPFGNADPVEAAQLFALLTKMTTARELEQIWDGLTVNPARAIGLPRYGIEVGNDADLVILDEDSVASAILHRARRLAVLKRGTFVYVAERPADSAPDASSQHLSTLIGLPRS